MTPETLVASMLRVEHVALSRGALEGWGQMGFSVIVDISGVDLRAIHPPAALHGYRLVDGSGLNELGVLDPDLLFRKQISLGQRRAIMRTVRLCLIALEEGLPTLVVDHPGTTRSAVIAAGVVVMMLGCTAGEALQAIGASGTPMQNAAVAWVGEQQR